jgi:hypothetical protein
MANRFVSVGDDLTLPPVVKVGEPNLPDRLSAAAQNATYAQVIPSLEAVNLTAFGHSYIFGDQEVAGSKWVDRVASRGRTLAITNRGVNGFRSTQTAQKVLQTWTPGSRGLVLLQSIVNDVRVFQGAANGPATTREAFRAILAYLTSLAAQQEGSGNLQFVGSWSTVVDANASGGNVKKTTTIGDYVDVAWNGDSCYVLTQFTSSATAGTVTATRSTTQSVISTTDTGGYYETTPAVIPLTGFGAGDHTVRLKLTAGTAFVVDALLVPNPAPPVIVIAKEGPVLKFNGSYVGTEAAGNTALLTNYTPAIDTVTAQFPTVLVTPQGGPAGWDANTMTVADGLHPNQKGSANIADAVMKVLGKPAFAEGLNALGALPAVTTPVPTYVAGTPAAPFQVTGLATRTGDTTVNLSWTAPPNGGATITDYAIQYRIGAGSWTTFAHTASTATSIDVTGLTNGTTYGFQVAAVNSVGTGTYSAEVTGQPVTHFFVDDFNRADASTLGTTSFGGKTYAIAAGTVAAPTTPVWSIASGKAYTSSSQADATAIITSGSADGTLEMVISTQSTGYGDSGLVSRYQDQDNFWLLYADKTAAKYKVMKKSGGVYSTLVTTAVNLVDGDVLKTVMAGNVQTWFVNGVQVHTVTDAAFATSVKHGMRQSATGGTNGNPNSVRFDSILHRA